jgi:hypothetical protein
MPPPPLRINKKSLIKVGLIRELWCFLEGYISEALGPWRRHPINPNFIISQLGSEAEASHERMTSPP